MKNPLELSSQSRKYESSEACAAVAISALRLPWHR
jgi:hypothetical protein